MLRTADAGQIVFRCPCGNEEFGGGKDRLIASGGTVEDESQKYGSLLRQAPFSQAVLRVAKKCVCGLPYQSSLGVGEDQKIVRACKCGRVA